MQNDTIHPVATGEATTEETPERDSGAINCSAAFANFTDAERAKLNRLGLTPESNVDDVMQVMESLAGQVLAVKPDFTVPRDLVRQ